MCLDDNDYSPCRPEPTVILEFDPHFRCVRCNTSIRRMRIQNWWFWRATAECHCYMCDSKGFRLGTYRKITFWHPFEGVELETKERCGTCRGTGRLEAVPEKPEFLELTCRCGASYAMKPMVPRDKEKG